MDLKLNTPFPRKPLGKIMELKQMCTKGILGQYKNHNNLLGYQIAIQ